MNLGGIADSLKVLKGQDLIKYELPHQPSIIQSNQSRFNNYLTSKYCKANTNVAACRKYRGIKDRGTPNEELCSSERNFCSNCSTMLWLWDHHWPELIHPFASAIDTELPEPAEMVCIMESSKPTWMRWPEGKKSTHTLYNKDSLEEWHKKHEYFVE